MMHLTRSACLLLGITLCWLGCNDVDLGSDKDSGVIDQNTAPPPDTDPDPPDGNTPDGSTVQCEVDSKIYNPGDAFCATDGCNACTCGTDGTARCSLKNCSAPDVVVADICKPAACTPGMDQTCNDNPVVSTLWGKCNADGTCSCNDGYSINPETGRCSDDKTACTPGKDWTCNDNPAISTLWGKCNSDGTCSCNDGLEINPTTGRCNCPPLPSCNWCGGAEDYDKNGCVTGWTCENGVDPCMTNACSSTPGGEDCGPDGYCDEATGLCWSIAPPAIDCGSATACNAQAEYCMRVTPGICGGDPVPDAGTCPVGCAPTVCANNDEVCLCDSFSCPALPTGCTDCGCLGLPGGCECDIDTQTGGITVHCMAP